MRKYSFWALCGFIFGLSGLALAEEAPYGLPVDCIIGETCFLQNLVDLDQESENIVDSFCGADSYNGHKGIDIRVLTLGEVAKGIPILAIKDGVVKGVRNNMEDRLITGGRKPQSIQQSIRGRECGNGLVIDHGDGVTSQYCHMKRGSVRFDVGERVTRGMPLGEMGLSGFSAFPHVHLSMRKNGELLDPLSGKAAMSASCTPVLSENAPFGPNVTKALFDSRNDIVSVGLTDRGVDFQQLKKTGTMPLPTAQSGALVVWGWALNLEAGDALRLSILKDKELIFEREEALLTRRKAQQFNFAGKRMNVEKGAYKARVEIMRDGVIIKEKTSTYEIN